MATHKWYLTSLSINETTFVGWGVGFQATLLLQLFFLKKRDLNPKSSVSNLVQSARPGIMWAGRWRRRSIRLSSHTEKMADPRVTLQLLQMLQGAVWVAPPASINTNVSGNSVNTTGPPSTTVLPITVAPTVTISTAPPSYVASPQTGCAAYRSVSRSSHQLRQQSVNH